MATDTRNIYWLAGFLEGEGCFSLRKNKKGDANKYATIVASSTDKDVIEKAKNMIGHGSIQGIRDTRKPGYKLQYYLHVTSPRRAAEWMMTLYPLMGERRRRRIKECISAWKNVPTMSKSLLMYHHPDGNFDVCVKCKSSNWRTGFRSNGSKYRICRVCSARRAREFRRKKSSAKVTT